jgi:multisubunit Na+/H+ antiporter MnhB subunit
MNGSTKAILVLAVGGILTIIAFIKMSVIGFYPSELLGLTILLAAGLAVLWVGNRMYTNAKKAAASAAARNRERN